MAPLLTPLVQHVLGEWISREITVCLVLPTIKALDLATTGKLFTEILSLPTLLALWPLRCVAMCKGVVHAVLSIPYLAILHPGPLLRWQLIKASLKPLSQLATVDTLWKILPKFLLMNYPHELPRTLTRPGTLTILPTPEKATSLPPLSPAGPITEAEPTGP